MAKALSTACTGGKCRAARGGRGVSDDLLADNLCVPGFNAPVMHRHSALSCFVARAMPSVPPAVAGNSGPRGVFFGGGVSDDLLAENLGVGFCLRPSPPVLLFSQGPQALPMLKRKAGRGAFNTMDV